MPQTTFERLLYIGILMMYLVLGVLFATRTPDWQAPDEPAHYNYIAQVAAGDLLPVIALGDWDNDYLEELKASGFAPELLDNLDTVQYEDHQPPLYYWVQTPVYLATDGNLEAMRIFSVLMGAITIMLTYAIASYLLPERRNVALATMALVAFIPQHLHILGSINNDALVGIWVALGILLCLRYLDGKAQAWQLGIVIGLIAVTKTTGYFMAGVVFITIIMRWWQSDQRDTSRLLHAIILFALPAAIFAGVYWTRNIVTYGFPDFLGLQEHDAVVIGQLRTAERIEELGFSAYLTDGIRTTFNSFWGQFGWMAAPMNGAIPYIYTAIFVIVLLAISGLILYALREKKTITGAQWIILGFVMLFAMLQFVYYNLTFVQFQGRYIFVGIIPFAFAFALGVDTWRQFFLSRPEWLKWGSVVLLGLFALLDLYLIWRVIPGALS